MRGQPTAKRDIGELLRTDAMANPNKIFEIKVTRYGIRVTKAGFNTGRTMKKLTAQIETRTTSALIIVPAIP